MQPTRPIKIRTPAKLNLALHIKDRREDGYHELESVMQSITIFDELTLRPREEPGITLSSALPFLPLDRRNLAYRAAALFFEQVGIRRYGVEINIRKRIPVGAGLGGGSANAAGTLVALNRMYETDLSEQQLMELGRRLGSDVPFCIHQGTCLASGTGDELARVTDMPRCTLVVAKPRRSISTAPLYQKYDELGSSVHPDVQALIRELDGPLRRIAARCGNSLQEAAVSEVPQIGEMIAYLQQQGALCAVMTGSGSAVFGIFPNNNAAIRCAAAMRTAYSGCFVSLATPSRPEFFPRH